MTNTVANAWIQADGALVLQPGAGNNVGISTTNPNAKLEVNGAVSASNVYVTATTGTVSGTYGYFKYISGSSIYGTFTGNGSGLTGVTAGSSDRLVSTSANVVAYAGGTVSISTGGVSGTAYFDTSGRLVAPGISTTTAQTSVTSLYASGIVGIGTTNSSATLTVSGMGSSYSYSVPGPGAVYTTSDVWTAPQGVTSVTVMALGGGGGGGGAGVNGACGGGGAGGSFAYKEVSVTPGAAYTVNVGEGGAGGAAGNNNGSNGGASWFGSTGTVYAQGGSYGWAGASGPKGTGSIASSIGTTLYAGGDGAAGLYNTRSGAGGGGAGMTLPGAGEGGTGASASGTTAGTITNYYGGMGGSGVLTGNNPGGSATTALWYGGGGGGACRAGSSGTSQAGGSGAQGIVALLWSVTANLGLLVETSSGVPLLAVASSGGVGIGTASPSYSLEVNGTAYAVGAAGALSDIREKKNVATIADGALKLIGKLRPVSFEWKSPRDIGMLGEQFGFIAQEVEKVLPQVVITKNDKNATKGLKPTELIPILTKAIQELKADNENLHTEIEALKRGTARGR